MVSKELPSQKEVKVMKKYSGVLLLIALFVLATLILAPPVQAEERVKLTGDEIKEILFTKGNVIFGVDHPNNAVWIGTALGGGKRHFHWQSLGSKSPRAPFPASGELTGTATIVNDQQCTTGYAEDRCFDIYRIGKDKYETWDGETLNSTWYRAN
jgi:hypothetical protein